MKQEMVFSLGVAVVIVNIIVIFFPVAFVFVTVFHVRLLPVRYRRLPEDQMN